MTEYSEGTKFLFVIGFVAILMIGVIIHSKIRDRNERKRVQSKSKKV